MMERVCADGMARQLMVELDAGMAQASARVAPSRARERSEFVPRAWRRALDAEAERRRADDGSELKEI